MVAVGCPRDATNDWAASTAPFQHAEQAGTAPIVRFRMDYGDGESNGPLPNNIGIFEHVYNRGGTFTVIYTAVDAAGRAASDTCTFTWTQLRSSAPRYQAPSGGNYIPYPGNGGGPTRCRDGSISNSSGRGTCSYHGGIAR